jgi:phosphohistidine phosphatase SixA
MKLYLVRHGIAEGELMALQAGREDPERRLTADGVRETREVARALKGRIAPQAILHSPYARAHTTAEIFAREFSCPLESSDLLVPEASPAALAEACERWLERGHTMLVSHEPLMGRFLSFLVTGTTQPATEFERAAVASLEWCGPGSSQLEFFLPPRLLLG